MITRPERQKAEGGSPRGRRRPRTKLGLLWRSTIGKKTVMAVTGLIMVGYLVVHMIANLKIFFGVWCCWRLWCCTECRRTSSVAGT